MNCLNCTHWDLKNSSLRNDGYGHCKAMPVEIPAEQRASRTFAAGNPCRFEKFTQAPAETVAKREKVIG